MEDTVLNETCIHSHIVMEQNVVKRKTVNDTDTGKVLRENIAELEELLRRIEVVCWWRSSEKQNNEIRKEESADFIFILELLLPLFVDNND